jgi:hypothetical protein
VRVVPVCMVGKADSGLDSSGPKSSVLDGFLNGSDLGDMNGSDR